MFGPFRRYVMIKIRPIKTEEDHAQAMAHIEELWGAAEGSNEAEVLEVLITLVSGYEERNHVIDPPNPIDAIRFRMEQENLTRKDLEPMIGSRARVSEILNGRRPLTLPMIRRLRRELGISADVLVNDSDEISKLG
jgi:HTH-type transcriptional regulator / antitoxin HigA